MEPVPHAFTFSYIFPFNSHRSNESIFKIPEHFVLLLAQHFIRKDVCSFNISASVRCMLHITYLTHCQFSQHLKNVFCIFVSKFDIILFILVCFCMHSPSNICNRFLTVYVVVIICRISCCDSLLRYFQINSTSNGTLMWLL